MCAGEERAYFGVARLPKVPIESANATEFALAVGANEFIGEPIQSFRCALRCDRHGNNDPRRLASTQRLDGDAHRGAGGDAIIDNDDGAPLYFQWWSMPAV